VCCERGPSFLRFNFSVSATNVLIVLHKLKNQNMCSLNRVCTLWLRIFTSMIARMLDEVMRNVWLLPRSSMGILTLGRQNPGSKREENQVS